VGAVKLRQSSLAPWAGVFLGAGAWFAHHQATSNTVYWNCEVGGPLFTGLLGLVFGFVALAGGWISWQARAAPPSSVDRPEPRNFGGVIGAGSAILFTFAILLQTLSGFIVPACQR
jgi:hypothetical protein